MTAKKEAPKPSEIVDAELEAEELRRELLADLPPLRPARRFRISHRNAFHNLILEASKSGTFDGEGELTIDTSTPEGIEQLQKLNNFVASIDEWAESIAENVADYIAWAEGKTQEHFIALFRQYQDELGESKRSEN